MLSFCMSYAELRRFDRGLQSRGQGFVLSAYEQQCVQESLRNNPFLGELLKRYPLGAHFKSALDRTEALARVARERGNRQGAEPLGVHNALFGSERAKTQAWLQGFPGQQGQPFAQIAQEVQRLSDTGAFDAQLEAAFERYC